MSTYASGTKLSELKLAEEPIGSEDVAPKAAAAPAPIPTAPKSAAAPSGSSEAPDRFVAKATVELETGRVEEPLWARAMETAGGDAAQAKSIYVRARATALLIERRERRERTSRGARAMNDAERRGADDGRAQRVAADGESLYPSATTAKRSRVSLIALALASLAIVAGLIAIYSWGGSPSRPDVARTDATAAAPISAQAAKPRPANPTGAVRQEISGEDFSAKVRELKEAGNWNVLVLYAAEWTRKQPGNPEAWKELGQGYVRLRQYRDALDAVTRATQLAPADYRAWQDLGQLNVELMEPDAALAAFGRAVQLNERDVASLVNIGTLEERRGRLSEARSAFGSALAVSPGDVEALCGAEAVAREEGRLKDAEALRRNIVAMGRACRAVGGSKTTAASAAPPPPRNTPSVYR